MLHLQGIRSGILFSPSHISFLTTSVIFPFPAFIAFAQVAVVCSPTDDQSVDSWDKSATHIVEGL